MKFTKEQFSEALKARMSANGKSISISDRTIKESAERIYARLEKRGSEDELEAMVTEYLPDFETINGNVRNDNSAFVNDWNKKHPQPTEPPKKDPPSNPAQPNDTMAEILKKLQDMEAKITASEEKSSIEAKKKSIRDTLGEKGVKDTKWLDKYFGKLSVTKESDVEKEVTDALELYNLSKAQGNGNATVGNSGGNVQKDTTDYSDIAAILKQERGLS